jgi:hypothetical protein
MDGMNSELNRMLDKVTVDMPDGSRVNPPRGIGLGYFETLKTISILALLQSFRPYSVYGDQGLVPDLTGWDAINVVEHLKSYGFLFEGDADLKVMSTTNTSPITSLKWAGAHSLVFRGEKRIVEKGIIANPYIGAFFQAEHWRRKSSLHSLCKRDEKTYKKYETRILRLYKLYFGKEFFEGDHLLNFIDGGISYSNPLLEGITKVYKLPSYRIPFEDTLFQAPFITPFKRAKSSVFPNRMAREFSKLRKSIFKKTEWMDCSVHFYTNPRIEYNSIYSPSEKLLPEWADLLYMFNYGASSGSFTYFLSGEQMEKAIQVYSLSSDPLKAYASGGYKILDRYHKPSIPSREWVQAVEGLRKIKVRSLDYVSRADLPTDLSLADDPMYVNEDLSTQHDPKRRKLEGDKVIPSGEEYESVIVQALKRKMVSGVITSADKFFSDPVLEHQGNEFVFDDEEVIEYEEDPEFAEHWLSTYADPLNEGDSSDYAF